MFFAGANNNLSLWEASLSSSYMCNKEQNSSISSSLTLFTFNLRVQPFGVNQNQFSTGRCFFEITAPFYPCCIASAQPRLIT